MTNEPVNSGSVVQDEKAPRSADAYRAWRRLYSNLRNPNWLTLVKTDRAEDRQRRLKLKYRR